MSNLYYNYRGDNAGQRGPAPTPTSQQHLAPPKDSNSGLPNFSVPPVQQSVQVRQSAHPSAQPAPAGFPSSQAWAADQSVQPQQQQQQTPQYQAQPAPHQLSLVNTSYPSAQASRPSGNHVMNGTRAAQLGSRRVPPYEDSLFQMMGKGFTDKPVRSTGPPPTSSLPLPQSGSLEQYQQVRSSASSNVFDPSEFPSLGGGLRTQGGMPVTAAALLNNTSAVDAAAFSGVGIPGASMNGLGSYDMYGMGTYDGRAKAVDAVTGTSASAEFNMQSEDFPALGGNPAAGAVRASMMSGAPNGPSLVANPGGRIGPSSSLAKPAVGDGYFDGAAVASEQSQQLHRAQGRPDQASTGVMMGRPGQTTDDLQVIEGMDGASTPQLARKGQVQGHARVPLEADTSPTKAAYQSRAPLHGTPARADLPGSEVSKRGDGHSIGASSDARVKPSQSASDTSTTIPNGDAIGMGSLPGSGQAGKPQTNTSLLSRMPGSAARSELSASESVLPADQYGMIGLLKYVGPDAEGTDANMLSIGVDLTMLGLDLNSSEPLHKTFANPWEGGQGGAPGLADASGSSQKNEEPEYKLPTCYYMQPPALKNSHFTKFQLETLFYVFYNMPRDVLQVLAAIELYNRKWMYHKDLKLWFTCEPEVLQGYERGAYIYFDIKSWEQRPFHDANQAFIQGLMTEDEVRSVPMPGQRSSAP